MKVIALQGTADSGKTTTLKALIAKLSQNAKIIACGRRAKTDKDLSQLANRLADQDDLWVLMEYRNKTVGITTEGDEWGFIESALNSMKKYLKTAKHQKKDLDVFICAVHTTNAMINQAKEIDCDKAPYVVSQFHVIPENRLQFDLAQAVILENALNQFI